MTTKFKPFDPAKKYLVTGAAGFIGFHLAKKLASQGAQVVGFDNINDYYDVNLKYARLEQLKGLDNFKFVKGDLADAEAVNAYAVRSIPRTLFIDAQGRLVHDRPGMMAASQLEMYMQSYFGVS